MIQKIFCWLWKIVWYKHLDDGERVVKVFGWRTAMIRTKYGQPRWVHPLLTRWEI